MKPFFVLVLAALTTSCATPAANSRTEYRETE